MKKNVAILIIALILGGLQQVSATKWRVNSRANVNANFSSLQAAINSSSVSGGDTLYCEGGSYFGNITVTKHVVIIGPGYFLSQNDSTQAYPSTSNIQNLYFDTGSDNSKVMGMKILGTVYLGNGYYDTIANISLVRNHIYSFNGGNQNYTQFSNISLINNYFSYDLSIYSKVTTAYIQNNIIVGQVYIGAITSDFLNNTIVYSGNSSYNAASFENSNVVNNIIIHVNSGPAINISSYNLSMNNSISHNVLSDATNSNYPSNYFSATLSATVVNSGSPDGKFELASGSPALGYGTSGNDCGAFGGSQPYVLSGLPFLVPHIYEATIPGTANKSDGLNITIKAKAQNQ